MSSAQEIKSIVLNWTKAISDGDRKGILAHHADTIRMFDFPGTVVGLDAYDRTWNFFFHNPRGPITFTPSEIEVDAGETVGFLSCLIHCDGTSAGPLDLRLTVGLRRIDGAWTVVHEHHSVPTVEERFIEAEQQ